jgi:hypothetical protein
MLVFCVKIPKRSCTLDAFNTFRSPRRECAFLNRLPCSMISVTCPHGLKSGVVYYSYEGEVLDKQQVVQHFKFGNLFKASWQPSGEEKQAPPGNLSNHQRNNCHHPPHEHLGQRSFYFKNDTRIVNVNHTFTFVFLGS